MAAIAASPSIQVVTPEQFAMFAEYQVTQDRARLIEAQLKSSALSPSVQKVKTGRITKPTTTKKASSKKTKASGKGSGKKGKGGKGGKTSKSKGTSTSKKTSRALPKPVRAGTFLMTTLMPPHALAAPGPAFQALVPPVPYPRGVYQ